MNNPYLFITPKGEITDSSGNSVPVSHTPTDVIWVNSEYITLLEVAMPTRNPSAIEQSLPFVLEEDVLSEIETMHCAWHATPKNKPLPVAVVNKDLMDIWKMALLNNNLRTCKLVPDIFLAPWSEGSWTLLILEHRSILRTNSNEGISGSHEFMAEYLKRFADMQCNAILAPGIQLPKQWKKHNPLQDESVHSMLEKQHHSPELINLLQGEYAIGFSFLRKSQDMILPGLVASLVLCLLLAGQVIHYLNKQSEKQQLDAMVVARAQQIFPQYQQGNQLRTVINAYLERLQQGLDEKQTGSWAVLEHTVPILSTCTNCVFEKLDFIDNGFSLRIGSYSQLDNVEKQIQTLNQFAIESKLQSITRENTPYYLLEANIVNKKS